MASLEVSAQQRRKLLAEGSPRLAEVGLAFLEAGRWGEALECLAAAGETSGLERLKREAGEVGDYFYAAAAARALGQELDTHQLDQIAQRAEETGKETFAAAASSAE